MSDRRYIKVHSQLSSNAISYCMPLILLMWIILGMCMKRASAAFAMPISTHTLKPAPLLIMISHSLQQESEIPTPSSTPSETTNPTPTTTGTTSPSPSITGASATSSLSETPSLSPTVSPVTSLTLTPTLGGTITPSETPTLVLLLTDTPLSTSAQSPEAQESVPASTSTATLIPYPTVSLIVPTPTQTPRLHYLDSQRVGLNLQKGNPSLMARVRQFWPIFLIALVWGGLIFWFLGVQILVRWRDN